MNTRYKLKESTTQSFPHSIPMMEIPRFNWMHLSATSGTSPHPRHGHRAVAVNELMIMFGGGSEEISADLHVFNTSTNTWLTPQVKGEVPRGYAAFGFTASNGKIIMFGGMQEYMRLSNDLYSLDVNTWEWKKLQSFIQSKDIPYPIPRIGHSFTYANELIYMFGGLHLSDEQCEGHLNRSIFKHTYLNELYTLSDSGKMVWNIPSTYGSPPTARESHSATYYVNPLGDNYLIIYGGMNSTRLGDVWFLVVRTMSWIQPTISGIPPLPRSLHSANMIGNRMIIFGGWVPTTNDATTKEVVWKCTDSTACLNLCKLTWEVPKINLHSPKARCGHSAVSIHSRVYIFSGRDGYTAIKGLQVCFEDLWYLEVDKPAKPDCPQLMQASATSLLLSWNPVPSASAYVLQIQLIASTSKSPLLEESYSKISRIVKPEILSQVQQRSQQSEGNALLQNPSFRKSPLVINSCISHHQPAVSGQTNSPLTLSPVLLSPTKAVDTLQIQNKKVDNIQSAPYCVQTNKSLHFKPVSLTVPQNNNGSNVGLPFQSNSHTSLSKKSVQSNFVWSLKGKQWVIVPQKTPQDSSNQKFSLPSSNLIQQESLLPPCSQSFTSNHPLSITAASTTQNLKQRLVPFKCSSFAANVKNASVETGLSHEPEKISQTADKKRENATGIMEIKNVALEGKEDQEFAVNEEESRLSDKNALVVKQNEWHNVGIVKDNRARVTNYCSIAATNELSDVKITCDKDIEIFKLVLDSMPGKTEVKPDTHYKIRVVGINSNGVGPWSDVSAINTSPQGRPSAPSQVKIAKKGSHTHISWQAPESPQKIIEYSIYLAVKHQQSQSNNATAAKFTKIYTGPANECTIHNNTWNYASIFTQNNNAAIVFRIAACNAKGYGQSIQVRWLQEDVYLQMKRVIGDVLGQGEAKKAKSDCSVY